MNMVNTQNKENHEKKIDVFYVKRKGKRRKRTTIGVVVLRWDGLIVI